MTTTSTLEDRLHTHYLAKADELHLPPMAFSDLFNPTRPVAFASLQPVRLRRTVSFAAAALVLVALIGGGILLRSRTVTPADSTPTTLNALPPTTQVAVAAGRPLELSMAPAGLQLVGQAVRPAGGEDVRAAVFVKRDAQNNITERVIARFGAIGLYGGSQQVTPPANLPTATSGSIFIDRSGRTVRVEYGLGTLGNLALDAYRPDEGTDGALSDEMQQIAATLQVDAGRDIRVTATLPDGWTLATVGTEPEQGVPSFYQAFEVDSPDGGAKLMIDNRMVNDSGYPYWEMSRTLQPVEIRGHSGYVTTHDYGPLSPDPNAPVVTDPTNAATILIWEEAPGHWVTMWVADNTTDQAIALANGLVPVGQDQWHIADATAPASTILPSVPSS